MSYMSRSGQPAQPPRYGIAASEGSPPDQGAGDDERRKRAAIAAQACETCRTRKSKCDEKRPKCGLCERLGVTCNYREPQPTKKDKTLVEMMTVLNRIDANITTVLGNAMLGTGGSNMSAQRQQAPDSLSPTSPASLSAVASPTTSLAGPSLHHFSEYSRGDVQRPVSKVGETEERKRKNVFPQLTPPHKLLMWRSVFDYLIQKDGGIERDLSRIRDLGSSYFIKKEMSKHMHVLPSDSRLDYRPARQEYLTAGALETRVEFVTIPPEKMRVLAKAFFETYHCSHPAVDPVEFEESLLMILRRGFGNGCEDSVVVLLVLALGEMAIEGASGQPWTGYPDSGIRGGSPERPPGLDFFNEARKRLGFTSTSNSLKTVQALVLVAIYYEACARHMDHYRTVMDACLVIQVILNTEHPINWSSARGDRIKVLFHVCNALENWFHFDLDMPGTGINELVDSIPLPGGDPDSYANGAEEQVALHFLATSSLARVINRVQQGVYHEHFTSELGLPYTGPPYQLLSELRRQLDQWRSLLPHSLQWYDDDRLNFPLADERSRIRGSRMFSTRMEDVANSPYLPSLDMMQAEMRARYYYVVMLVNRPHVFKLIHYPDTIESQDRDSVIQCIKACLLWPVALFPLRDKKRLIPYLYAWTTNFMGVLILLRLVLQPGQLRRIVEPYIIPEELETTIITLLEWIKDASQIDGTAEWAWKLFCRLYDDVDFVLERRILV